MESAMRPTLKCRDSVFRKCEDFSMHPASAQKKHGAIERSRNSPAPAPLRSVLGCMLFLWYGSPTGIEQSLEKKGVGFGPAVRTDKPSTCWVVPLPPGTTSSSSKC